ncbi:MAG: MarR family EPS-associated transcriptional regulator [Acidithiobacillus ferrooxidans]
MNKTMLDDATRYQLLKLLTEHPEMTQRELAAAMGISLGKTNYCINALIEKGMVKSGNFRRNPNKDVYAYLLTPEGVQEKARVTVRFLHRKMAEYDALQAEIAALRREVDGLSASGLDAGRGAA